MSLAWLVPVVLVGATGALGSLAGSLWVTTWLAAIGAGAAGVIAHISLEPAPYARRAAQAVATVAGVILLLLLSRQAGHPIL